MDVWTFLFLNHVHTESLPEVKAIRAKKKPRSRVMRPGLQFIKYVVFLSIRQPACYDDEGAQAEAEGTENAFFEISTALPGLK